MKPYADTNFYTRLYLPLPESRQADRLLAASQKRGASRLPITWLHGFELTNAFELSVWQGKQMKQPFITTQTAAVALLDFKTDLKNEDFLEQASLDISALQPLFEQTVARYTAKHGFRTYDILHVVSALLLNCDYFFSFDAKALKLAKLEGLATEVL
jgi:hypothetical protein